MATSTQPEIHVIQPEQPPAPDEGTILQWVLKVDGYIDQEGLEIMKLSVQSELSLTECDKVKHPSDLYHALKIHYEDPAVLLARFIYALESLGHRRYGCRAVRELEEAHHPSRFDLANLKADRNNFILHQSLAMVCCILPRDCYDNFIAHFAKKLRVNPKKFQTPCHILTKLLEQKFVTPDNQLNLIEEALIKIELSESKIKEYVESCLAIAGTKRLKSSSFCPSSKTSDSSPDQRKQYSLSRNQLEAPSSSDLTNTTADPRTSESSDLNTSSEPSSSGSQSPTNMAHVEVRAAVPTPNEHTPLIGQGEPDNNDRRTAGTRKKRLTTTVCCIIFLIILLVLAVGAAVLTAYAVKQYTSNQPTTQRYRENSSVILTEVNHFFTESLSVTEDTEHLHDFYHDIEVYQVESKCSALVNRTVYTISSSNSSFTQTFYALAGSTIALHVCGSTNSNAPAERLDIVLQNHLEGPNSNGIVKLFHLGPRQRCKDITFSLQTSSYHTVTFLPEPPLTHMTLDFEMSYNLRAIDPIFIAELATANYTLHADLDSCKFSLSAGIRHSCFVAVIMENPNTSIGDVHIQLSYGNRRGGFIAGVVLLSIVFVAILITVLAIMCVQFKM